MLSIIGFFTRLSQSIDSVNADLLAGYGVISLMKLWSYFS